VHQVGNQYTFYRIFKSIYSQFMMHGQKNIKIN